MKKIVVWQLLFIALSFGVFQCLMPILGYFLCVQFESYIVSFDHWIAFVLLSIIGGKMIFEAIKERKEEKKNSTNLESNIDKEHINEDKFSVKEIIFLAIATSIDALAVGITFAFFDVNIFGAGAIIGITTFALCCGGVLIGNFFGNKFKTLAEICGGVILVLLGIKILLEHLGVLVF